MARMTYLLRRGASYYARMKVPLDLIDIVGKRELVKALGTKDAHDAKRLVWPVVEAWIRQFEDMRSRRVLTEDDKAHATWQHYNSVLDRYESDQRVIPSSAAIDAATERAVEAAAGRGLDARDPLAVDCH